MANSRGKKSTKSNRPFEYIVYSYRPFNYRFDGLKPMQVATKRIPHGKSYHDVVDSLPVGVVKLKVVKAYSAATAKDYAKKMYGIKAGK